MVISASRCGPSTVGSASAWKPRIAPEAVSARIRLWQVDSATPTRAARALFGIRPLQLGKDRQIHLVQCRGYLLRHARTLLRAEESSRSSSFCVASCLLRPRHDLLCARSEEHTSELQSRGHLVCRLLLEKKKPYVNTHC